MTPVVSMTNPEGTFVEPIASLPTYKKPDWEVVEPLHYVNEEVVDQFKPYSRLSNKSTGALIWQISQHYSKLL